MTASGQACPRCNEQLGRLELRGVGLEGCPKCKGMLVPLTKLASLLEATSVDLLKTFNPDAHLNPVGDQGGGEIACPNCSKAMENDNYCAANLVFFNRCNGCSLLWLDSEELGTMTLMWARMESRVARTQAELRAVEVELDSAINLTRMKRAVAGLWFRGF